MHGRHERKGTGIHRQTKEALASFNKCNVKYTDIAMRSWAVVYQYYMPKPSASLCLWQGALTAFEWTNHKSFTVEMDIKARCAGP